MAHVLVVSGLHFNITPGSLERDLELLKIFHPERHVRCVDNPKEMYGDSCYECTTTGYYMFYHDVHMYIGYTKPIKSEVTEWTVGIFSVTENDVERKREKFRQFCIENNVDVSTLGVHLYIDTSF